MKVGVHMDKEIDIIIGTLSTGGAERVVSNLSMKIDKNISTSIILFGENARIEYPYHGNLEKLDFINHNKNIFYKIYSLFYRVFKLKKRKSDAPTRTYLSFLEYPNLLNLLSRKTEKTVISVRNHMSTKHNKGIKNYLWKFTIKYLYARADIIVAVSEEIKNDLHLNFGLPMHKVRVINNSYDLINIKQKSEENIDEEYKNIFSKPVIITAGRLDCQKGQWHLIRAFSEIAKQDSEIQLVILGRGKIEEELRVLADQYNLTDRIHFLGFQENPFKFIKNSKLFILPSRYEGFPNALAEAMACEVPVISTDCLSGPREILAPDEFDKTFEEFDYKENFNRYGLLIPNFESDNFNSYDTLNPQEIILKEEILKLINDEDRLDFYGKKSIERIEDFEISKIIKQWEEILT